MKNIILITALLLTGCATPPRWLAHMYDSQDPCQVKNYGGDWSKIPSYCGSTNNRIYIYDNNSARIGYIK